MLTPDNLPFVLFAVPLVFVLFLAVLGSLFRKQL